MAMTMTSWLRLRATIFQIRLFVVVTSLVLVRVLGLVLERELRVVRRHISLGCHFEDAAVRSKVAVAVVGCFEARAWGYINNSKRTADLSLKELRSTPYGAPWTH